MDRLLTVKEAAILLRISQSKLSMLIELVRDGSLSLPAAAKKANLDVAMFKAKMAAAL